MADIGTAYVRVAPNMTGMQGKIAAAMKGEAAGATKQLGDEVNSNSGHFQGAIGKLGGIAKVGGLAIASGLAAGAAGLVALTTKSLLASSQLEQQLGGAEAVFGEYADFIKAKADDAYTNAGLSQNEFLQGANKMGSLFQGAGFSVQESMNMSADAMQRASDIASIMGIDTTSALEAVTGMAKGNFTMMDNLGVAMNDTAIGAYAMTKGINKSTAAMSIQEKVGLAQQMFMEKTAKYAGNYAKENDTLAGSINTTKKAFQDFLATGNVTGFVNSLVNTIKIAVPQIVALLPQLVQGISSILDAFVPAIAAALPVLVPALIKAVVNLLNALVAALPTIVQVLVDALPILIGAFVQLFLAILQALPQIVKIISEAMPQIIDAIVSALTSPASLTAIIMGAVMLLLALVEAIPIIVAALTEAIPTIVKNIVKTLTSPEYLSAMLNAGVQLFQSLRSGIGKMQEGIYNAAAEIIRGIAHVLAPSNLSRIGSDLVRGLWSGIQSMGGWLKDNIISFVKDKIPGPVKKILGINSPSKLFAEYGKFIDQGLAQGVDKHAGLVSTSVSSMADDAIASMVSSDLSANVAASARVIAQPGAEATAADNSRVYNIYPTLGSADAVKEFFRQLNQDTINVGMGITPVQGGH